MPAPTAPRARSNRASQRLQVYSNDNASAASDYQNLIVAYRNNAPVQASDVAQVYDGVENIRNMGLANGKSAMLVTITQQPGANVIQVVDSINTMIPQLQHGILPPAIDLDVIQDTTVSIRNSVRDVEITLVISTILVVLVVFFFLRNLARHPGAGGLGAAVAARHFRLHVSAGLHARQFLADGADHLDRLRGRQHHRGAGKCHPPPRTGREPA